MAEQSPRPHNVPPRSLFGLLAEHHDLRWQDRDVAAVDVPITGISLDSRSIRQGDLYLARPGAHTHGIDHLDQAMRAGAVAVLTDPTGGEVAGAVDVPVILADDPKVAAGPVAAWIYGHPATELLSFAVTGTNGKTTTAWLIDAGLRAAGRRTGLIGTVATVIDGEVLPAVRTTPEAPDLQALLAVMRERGTDSLTMEVSSHALSLGRVDGLTFDLAGFTNLSQDHLDFHADMADYFAAKAALFTPDHSHRAVVTIDDHWGRELAAIAAVPVQPLGEAAAPPAWSWMPHDDGLRLRGHDGYALDGYVLDVPVTIPGNFNLANAALAAVMLHLAGIADDAIQSGIAGLTVVPGRMQPIEAGQPFTVLVDYAHTPEAVTRLLAEARLMAGPHTVTVVLGCGGDRDAAKRPLMGRAAADGADLLIITDDNPRSEDPATIRAAMLIGVAGASASVAEIGDRADAIAHAVNGAGPGDVVVIAGKGHESGQEVGGVVTAFDDAAIALAALAAAGWDAPNRVGAQP